MNGETSTKSRASLENKASTNLLKFPTSKNTTNIHLFGSEREIKSDRAQDRSINKPSNVYLFNSQLANESKAAKKLKWQIGLMERLELILEQEYRDADFGVSQLAIAAGISQRQLFRKLRALLDITPGEYIRRFRLEKAKQLLEAGKTAQFVSYEVGFSSQSYFGLCFKVHTGLSPYQYKKLQMNNE